MLESIGATFTDGMVAKNTHLISKEAKGPKYHKAVELGLHAVNIEWLFHIMEYGYYGKKDNTYADKKQDRSSRSGCEKKFTLTFSPRRVQPVNKRKCNDSSLQPSKEFEPTTRKKISKRN